MANIASFAKPPNTCDVHLTSNDELANRRNIVERLYGTLRVGWR